MTIEALLERIANSNDAILATLQSGPVTTTVIPATSGARTTTEILSADTPPTEPRKRGRPPKVETPAAPPAADLDLGDAPPADDDFLGVDTPAPPKEYTLLEVRAAMIALQKRYQNPEKARQLLKDVGGAADLKALDPSKYAAVIDAASKA